MRARFPMFCPLILLAACNNELQVSTYAPGCEDLDFSDPPDEDLVVEHLDKGWRVTHTGVFQACDATPELTVTSEDRDIVVHETWSGGDAESCTTCYAPELNLLDSPRGRVTVLWYLDADEIAFDSVSFKAK